MVAPNEHFEPQSSPDATELTSPELVHALLRLLHIARHRRKTILRSLCVAVILGALYFALAPRYSPSTIRRCIVSR